MKTFESVRPHDEAIEMLKAAKWKIDTTAYDEGSDWVRLENEHDTVRIMWSTFNGHFNGVTIAGVSFNHETTEFEKYEWFMQLLNIVFIAEKTDVIS